MQTAFLCTPKNRRFAVVDAHYDEPRLVALYDEDNAGRWDVDFYAGMLGTLSEQLGPLRIADGGCGTGSFAVELARAGHTVTGIDPAPGMLAAARSRDGAELVTWLEGTAADLPAGPFDAAVMTGHAFQCLLTEGEILSTLEAVRSRLTPGGTFFFESRNPAARAWLEWDSSSAGPELQESSAGTLEVEWELIAAVEEPDGVVVTFEDRTRFLADGAHFASRSTLKFTPADVLAGLLEKAGFSAVDWYGDWNGGPLHPASGREIIVAARTPS
ncbi:class I SAM-dependent methyltransferase [Arthrobacter sunyaminii]|uniref:Class I SAM-dependent methyltransferase n=1 Tax=Arthrobacter sunyaminii TaxID=2816859 RepID=A0A975XLP9_9MICC|nr:class I SAM-dependent methyltransferase [Arthrobacter sunyaminii]MBO0908221.1 class I SAM-dependent methyltransferase [Arthrobacter sunyaminii]QWQ37220.1 class I SAM-dependent methyltransferase [Arthrobacter sunyaminii]